MFTQQESPISGHLGDRHTHCAWKGPRLTDGSVQATLC
jgi:hypothetical protein